MISAGILVIFINVLINRHLFKSGYDDASKREKIVIDLIGLGVVVSLFLFYMFLISI